MTRPTTDFCTFFKNIPYTNEEWEQKNKWRAEFAERNPYYAKLHPEKLQPVKHRPNHAYLRGPSAHSHEQARKTCEEALKNGAQLVGYSVWHKWDCQETWHCTRDKVWYQK